MLKFRYWPLVTALAALALPTAALAQQTDIRPKGATTVTGSVTATQSGTWNINAIATLPATPAGTSVIGKVGIDQTTPGTTNAVADTGKYNVTQPSLSDGNRSDLQLGAKGSLHTEVWGLDQAAGMKVLATNIDGQAVSGQGSWGVNYTFNGSTVDRIRSIINSTDSTGVGIQAAGLVGQRDDTSPSSVTENQFGNVRIGAQHQLLTNENGHYPYSSINGAPATPLRGASGNVANASAVATLTGTATTTVYITGFTCTAGGSTSAALVDIAITGTLGGTLTYTVGTPAGATAIGTPVGQSFYPGYPASAVNTPIVVTMPALGTGNAHAACVATGYYM